MQSAINFRSIFLCMSRSTIAGQLPHGALQQLRLAEITTPASQLEAHIQTAPVEQFPERPYIVEQSAFKVADKGQRQCPRKFQPKS
jgi:hypothetical protein